MRPNLHLDIIKAIQRIGVLSATVVISGCSIHPLVEDIAPLNTVAVVNKLRCEIRTSIKKEFSELIRRDPVSEKDPAFAERAIYIVEEEAPDWNKIERKKLSSESNRLIDRYDGALIFMDFTFMNTEENNNDTDINLLSTLVRGTDSLNIKASNNRRRSSTRNFRTQDSFEGILRAPLKCEGRSRNPDYFYPVTGEIGLYEIIDTFLQLNESRSLIEGVPKDRLFADTLAFSTTVSGTLGPKITLSPIGKAVSLANASFTSLNSRTDVHTVIVGLSLPLEQLALAQPTQKSNSTSTRRTQIVSKQSPANQSLQLNAFIDEQVRRNFLMQIPALSRTGVAPLL